MQSVYVTASQALLLCNKAEEKIAADKPASFAGNYGVRQASSPEQVRAALAHIKSQIKEAKVLSEEQDIVVCIASNHHTALAWALGKLPPQ